MEVEAGHRMLEHIYYQALRIRKYQEQLWLLQRLGKSHFCITGEGHEIAQLASVHASDPATDHYLPYYRDVGIIMALGVTIKELMLQVFAKDEDPVSRGRDLINAWSYPRHRIYPSSAPVATQTLHAVGIAYANKYRKEKSVVITYFGDGATSQGDFYEALNFATIHKLAVVFFCENNGYAVSVPLDKQSATPIFYKALGFGIPGVEVDGTDYESVLQATIIAFNHARSGNGPYLLDVQVPRLMAHSSDDNVKAYITDQDIDLIKSKDPIIRFKNTYQIPDEVEQKFLIQISKEIEEATEYAEKASYCEDLYGKVFI